MTEKTYTEAEVRVLVAAALQRAAQTCKDDVPQWARDAGQTGPGDLMADLVLALIDTDHAAALEAVKAREDEAQALIYAARQERDAAEDQEKELAEELRTVKHKLAELEAAIRAGKVQP